MFSPDSAEESLAKDHQSFAAVEEHANDTQRPRFVSRGSEGWPRMIENPLKSIKLWSRPEILASPCPVPKEPGLYAWFFRNVPGVPKDGCLERHGFNLLYVGISPARPPTNGRPPSRQTLRDRVRFHMAGNAEGSTLRLTLGCLLSETLSCGLRRTGSGSRMILAEGEDDLNTWLAANAQVGWLVQTEPWLLEHKLIQTLSLPLNLLDNKHHAFHPVLSKRRSEARRQAEQLPIWNPKAK